MNNGREGCSLFRRTRKVKRSEDNLAIKASTDDARLIIRSLTSLVHPHGNFSKRLLFRFNGVCNTQKLIRIEYLKEEIVVTASHHDSLEFWEKVLCYQLVVYRQSDDTPIIFKTREYLWKVISAC